MSKDWERKARIDLFASVDINDLRIDATIKIMKEQRTQLLARVRKEVIGGNDIEYTVANKPKETILKYSTRDNYYNPVRNQLRKEQLKKLEVISEEGK